jgi:hypothetical protein
MIRILLILTIVAGGVAPVRAVDMLAAEAATAALWRLPFGLGAVRPPW